MTSDKTKQIRKIETRQNKTIFIMNKRNLRKEIKIKTREREREREREY